MQGTLTDGTVFDTNMEKKNQPALQFKVGIGKVIKVPLISPFLRSAYSTRQGWDQALLTMNVGEHAKLTIEAEGAYGKKVRVASYIGEFSYLVLLGCSWQDSTQLGFDL